MDDVRDPLQPGKWKIVLAIGVVGLLVAGLTVALIVMVSRQSSDRDDSCPAAAMRAVNPSGELDEVERVSLMIDLYSNDPAYVLVVRSALRPILQGAVDRGASISLVADPGYQAELVSSTCLDGSKVFEITSVNDRRREIDLMKAVEALDQHTGDVLESVPVRRRGSPVRLLQRASIVANADSDASTQGGEVVYLWSDFLSNAPDCLNPEGEAANERLSKALVTRCKTARSFERVYAPVHLLGLGSTPRSIGFELWARELAFRTCLLLESDCYVS